MIDYPFLASLRASTVIASGLDILQLLQMFVDTIEADIRVPELMAVMKYSPQFRSVAKVILEQATEHLVVIKDVMANLPRNEDYAKLEVLKYDYEKVISSVQNAVKTVDAS